MSIFDPSDRSFENVPHARFGVHCFTLAHSAGQAKGLLGCAGVCLVITACIYLFTAVEWMKLVGMLPALVLILAGVLGGVQLVRSRHRFHIYERGVVHKGPRDETEIAFDRVTEAVLDLTENPGTVSMKFRLHSGPVKIAFNDGTSMVERHSRQRMSALVHHIVSRLPGDVPLKGLHNLKPDH
ncbi:MAG: hypothetical protein GC164_07470 [Phycisphaera sp.]|nr:hypothetical protein [Phycisphaera sp.]